jgi:hypothetical protein
MNNDEIILDPVLRRSARLEREYWFRVLGDTEYKRIVSNTDPSHIYTWSGWPLKVDLFRDKKQE